MLSSLHCRALLSFGLVAGARVEATLQAPSDLTGDLPCLAGLP
ncbi:hypothetical protein SAMN05428989_3353 [Pseudoxanthomonas sp. GM95]|nr:hypothetical protein [Pseudoxanthomonas sp. GM95]SEM20430.1 hypothetical protein SAMN05428989_3353 [Pseudoxanthomonas sp. GM95]